MIDVPKDQHHIQRHPQGMKSIANKYGQLFSQRLKLDFFVYFIEDMTF